MLFRLELIRESYGYEIAFQYEHQIKYQYEYRYEYQYDNHSSDSIWE